MTKKEKVRLLVLTDISSIQTGDREPDDTQSLVRLLLYANHFDIEGLIATYTEHWDGEVKPEYIREVIHAYAQVRERLALHDPEYPTAQALLDVVKSGNPWDGLDQIGPGKDTEASEWIISRADRADDRPLWISIWGGTTDLAQALWKVRHTRSGEETARFVSRLRVYSIGDQYGIGSWIRDEFPDLFYVLNDKVFRGMYKGGDRSLTTWEWLDRHVCRDRGPLGAAYPNYDGWDPWGKVVGLKEGDSPAFMYLLPNGLGDPEKPEYGGWGGRFRPVPDRPRHYTDAADCTEDGDDPGEWITVSRWRRAYQASFAARMEWCLLPPDQAEREPVAIVKGERIRDVEPGETVELDGSDSIFSGKGRARFHWFAYREAGTFQGEVQIIGADQPRARIVLPESFGPGTVHIILEVTEHGKHALSSYCRVILQSTEKPRG